MVHIGFIYSPLRHQVCLVHYKVVSPVWASRSFHLSTEQDFEDQNATLVFSADSPINTQKCGTFYIIDDNIVEVTESFTVTATGAVFLSQKNSMLQVIQDNDGKGALLHVYSMEPLNKHAAVAILTVSIL